MLYYLGKGTEFKKENCKEYKTIEGALKAAAKDESFVVWDENGKIIGSLTDNVPDGALETNPDGSVNTYDAAGNKVGTVDAATVAALTGDDGQQGDAGASTGDGNGDGQGTTPPEPEKGQNGANTEPQQRTDTGADGDTGGDDEQQDNVSESDTEKDKVIVPQGTMKVTVICDGTLNLRRSPHWGNTNVCGRASRGQSYYVKEIHTVDGKKMVRTIDDIYLSGASEHVQFEQL